MICDKDAMEEFLTGADMIAHTLYVVKDKTGEFLTYALGVSKIESGLEIIRWVYATERKEIEQEWTEADEANRPYY